MKSIKFTLETITPLFIAGADGRTPELRPPSIKGMMRFWWRAYKYAQLSLLPQGKRIEKLYELEGEIFGSSSKGGRKSSFSIRIIPKGVNLPTFNKFPTHNIQVSTSKGKTFSINILEYMAYGTCEYVRGQGNKFVRPYLDIGIKFEVFLTVFNDEYKQDILESLYFWSAFGSLGAKARNGFGNFIVIDRKSVFSEINELFGEEIIPSKDMLSRYFVGDDIPPFSAFSKKAKLFKSKTTSQDWGSCLADVSKIYRECRGQLEDKHQYKKRQYIGAPLDPANEGFKSLLDRHSKPYFIKVIKEGERQYRSYILYLPSKYCEGLEKDRSGRQIDHRREDRKFEKVCNEFNKLLMSKLEVIL